MEPEPGFRPGEPAQVEAGIGGVGGRREGSKADSVCLRFPCPPWAGQAHTTVLGAAVGEAGRGKRAVFVKAHSRPRQQPLKAQTLRQGFTRPPCG